MRRTGILYQSKEEGTQGSFPSSVLLGNFIVKHDVMVRAVSYSPNILPCVIAAIMLPVKFLCGTNDSRLKPSISISQRH